MSESRRNILVIDDDITIRKLIGHHLKKSGYQVLEAEGAAEGFNLLNTDRVDLVLCDVTMEEMDGFAFCKKVRENEKYRVLPFVFVTAKSSFEDKSKAVEAGGDDIITKPFEIEELLLKVQSLIRRTDIYKVYGIKKDLERSFTQDNPKILLVDDDLTLSKLFQYNLNKAGFECVTANGAKEGYARAKAVIPDIIISDIMMPETDGFVFRKMLLEDKELKSIPFVFLTSKGEEDDILEGYDLGITDYVLKTAGPKIVVAKVSAIIKSLNKERQKIVEELHNAADSLRVKVVPDNKPVFKGFDISHWHIPFQGIPGGDFIDYFKLDENNIAVILGDVMGKKWGAWYFAFAYAGYVRSSMRMILQETKAFSPSSILQQVNRSVYQDAKISEVFATLSIIIINNSNNEIRYTGAGDLPVIYYNKASGNIVKYKSKGMLLGFTEDGGYDDIVINAEHGDKIVLMTDGIIESRNKEGEQFGDVRMEEIIAEHEGNLMSSIKNRFNLFTGEKYEDDVSLLIISCL